MGGKSAYARGGLAQQNFGRTYFATLVVVLSPTAGMTAGWVAGPSRSGAMTLVQDAGQVLLAVKGALAAHSPLDRRPLGQGATLCSERKRSPHKVSPPQIRPCEASTATDIGLGMFLVDAGIAVVTVGVVFALLLPPARRREASGGLALALAILGTLVAPASGPGSLDRRACLLCT